MTNGASNDQTARIYGDVEVTGALTNFGAVIGHFGSYVHGLIVNGADNDTKAFISGGLSFAGTLNNFGAIDSIASPAVVTSSGVITNGSATDTRALIESSDGAGVRIFSAPPSTASSAPATIQNFGTVSSKTGVDAEGALELANGAANDSAAVIDGQYGVHLHAGGMVTNFGLIEALRPGVQGSDAVLFSSASDVLLAEAGSTFIGVVAAGLGLIDVVAGQANFDGGLTTRGLVDGAGTLLLAGGKSVVGAGARLTVAGVTVSGAKTAQNVETNLAYAGDWTQSGGRLTVNTGHRLTFTGAADSFTGALAGVGQFTFDGGADTFSALTLSAARTAIAGASVTLLGSITITTALVATTPDLIVGAGGATLRGRGTLELSNSAANSLHGASSTAILINFNDKILAAGQIGAGSMILVNDAAGVIAGFYATALDIDTGAQSLVNRGLIEAIGAGGVTIAGEVTNTGTLAALGGDLTVEGAVAGAGAVRISGGMADFGSDFSQNVVFGPSGELELADALAYGGTLTGFSKTGATTLDLGDIAFGADTTASFSGTGSAGVLSVSDGSQTATFKLAGNYTRTTFTVSDDGHGGTAVVGHPTPAAPAAFATTMAAFAAGADGGTASAGQGVQPAAPLLANPAAIAG